MKKREITSRFVNDDLAQVEQQLLINQLVDSIESRKMSIILQRIKERFDIDFDIEKDNSSRFKQISIEYTMDHEHIYFDDGSEQGHLLVSFEYFSADRNFDYETLDLSIGFNYK